MKLANYEAWLLEATKNGWSGTLLVVDGAVRALAADLGLALGEEVSSAGTPSLEDWIRDNAWGEPLAQGHEAVRGSATLLRAAVDRDLKVFRDRMVSANRALREAQTHRASLGENLRLRGLYGSCTPHDTDLGCVERLTPEDIALGHIDRLLLELQEAKKTSRTTSS